MAVQWRVAVVEHDLRLARAVAAALRKAGYQVRSAHTAGEGLDLVHDWNPDLVVVGVALPDLPGHDVFGRFRDITDAALIGLTGGDRVADVVAGLRAGADDCLARPFALEELAARVHAVLRRSRGNGSERMEVSDLTVDVEAGSARRGPRRLDLTAIEFRLLATLARQAGKLLSQGQIMDIVWPVGQAPDSNSIEVHVGRLRRKLEAAGEPRLLHTVRGMGYVLKP